MAILHTRMQVTCIHDDSPWIPNQRTWPSGESNGMIVMSWSHRYQLTFKNSILRPLAVQHSSCSSCKHRQNTKNPKDIKAIGFWWILVSNACLESSMNLQQDHHFTAATHELIHQALRATKAQCATSNILLRRRTAALSGREIPRTPEV